MSSLADCKIYWRSQAGSAYELQWYEISYRTFYSGQAGKLEFSFLAGDAFSSHPKLAVGQQVVFVVAGKEVFIGRIFSLALADGVYKVVCYDQLRYLLNQDSMIFYNQRPHEIIKKIAAASGLNLGSLAEVPYTIPLLAFEGKAYLDMIGVALKDAYHALGKRYLFYDRAGNLTLRAVGDSNLDLVIDGDSLLGAYSIESSIDSQVYNEVKLNQLPIEKGFSRSSVAKNQELIGSWGKLRYFKKVGPKLNPAQVQAEAKAILQANQKPKEYLRLKAIGDIRCIAGFRPYVKLPDGQAEGYYLLESAQHDFSSGGGHTMVLECVR